MAYTTTTFAFAGVLAFGIALPADGAEPDTQEMIRDALSAAPPAAASAATVKTMDGKVLI